MHLLKVDSGNYQGQADPYILESGGRYYIYVTGHDGVYAYHSDNLFEGWEYHGIVTPTFAELGTVANWSLKFNPKNVKMGLIKSNG